MAYFISIIWGKQQQAAALDRLLEALSLYWRQLETH